MMIDWAIAMVTVFVCSAFVCFLIDNREQKKKQKEKQKQNRKQKEKEFLRDMWELGY